MRAPALRLRHAGREPFKGEDEELTFPARLPPRADSHRSQKFALCAGQPDLRDDLDALSRALLYVELPPLAEICAVALEFSKTSSTAAPTSPRGGTCRAG